MKALKRMLPILALLPWVSYGASRGVIEGTIKDPAGSPFKGAFVRARSISTGNITISVLSDREGRYRFNNLMPGEYQVWTAATGYKDLPPTSAKVAADELKVLNLTLQKGTVRWRDLSNTQAIALLPDGKGKKAWLSQCMI